LYNLALEEMDNAVEKDSTFRTGKEWAGVWTRDISYSIILSMAYLQPKVAMNSLMKKSTPTKGLSRIREPAARIRALPTVSFGRRRLGKSTKPGSKDWLEKAYTIVKNSIEDDYAVAYDDETDCVASRHS
jgi:hypothetical protein